MQVSREKVENNLQKKVEEHSEVKELLKRKEKPESSQTEDVDMNDTDDDDEDDDSDVAEDVLGMLEFDDDDDDGGSREQNEAVKHLELELQNWKPICAKWDNKGFNRSYINNNFVELKI